MEETFNIGGRLLVLFDGHCGFCNRAVRWLLRRDRLDRLRFVALDSEKVRPLLCRHGYGEMGEAARTMLVVYGADGSYERVLARSDAVVALLHELPQPWPGVGVTLKWVPRAVRDLGYRMIARWRYRIWGRLESCPVPTAEERARFL